MAISRPDCGFRQIVAGGAGDDFEVPISLIFNVFLVSTMLHLVDDVGTDTHTHPIFILRSVYINGKDKV